MSAEPLKDRGVTQGDSRSDKKCPVLAPARVTVVVLGSSMLCQVLD